MEDKKGKNKKKVNGSVTGGLWGGEAREGIGGSEQEEKAGGRHQEPYVSRRAGASSSLSMDLCLKQEKGKNWLSH